mgnify:CR=1 FL=1|jgi:hypothetical protein
MCECIKFQIDVGLDIELEVLKYGNVETLYYSSFKLYNARQCSAITMM